jgi:hypothetical protein
VANPAFATEPTPAELAAITPQEWRTRLTGLFWDEPARIS